MKCHKDSSKQHQVTVVILENVETQRLEIDIKPLKVYNLFTYSIVL